MVEGRRQLCFLEEDGVVVLFWSALGFFLGAIPFAVILSRWIAGRDARSVADGNPGGMNALRVGGIKTGLPVIVLDIAKGFVPVYLARRAGIEEWGLVPVCLAPAMGHAFSPFLKFRGGKALAATGGAWLAVKGVGALFAYASLALPFTLLQVEDAWSANAGMLALLIYSLLFGEPWLKVFAVLNTILIAYTHRRELFRASHFRPWVVNLFSGRKA